MFWIRNLASQPCTFEISAYLGHLYILKSTTHHQPQTLNCKPGPSAKVTVEQAWRFSIHLLDGFTGHPGIKLRANLRSISHRCHLSEVAFVCELTEETIHLPLGCLQGGGLMLYAVTLREGLRFRSKGFAAELVSNT